MAINGTGGNTRALSSASAPVAQQEH